MSDLQPDFVIEDNDPSSSDTEDNSYETSDIDFSHPQVVVLIGKPRRGKSNALKYFVLKNSVDNQIFKKGLIFTGSKFNNEYDWVSDDYVFEGFQSDVLDVYLKELEREKEEKGKIEPSFVVFDDLTGILSKFDGKLINFMTRHRHYNISCFLSTQHLNTGTNTALREVTTQAVMFHSTGTNTLKSLHENFGSSFHHFSEWKEFFWEHTKEPFTALLYDTIDEEYGEFRAPLMDDVNVKLKY